MDFHPAEADLSPRLQALVDSFLGDGSTAASTWLLECGAASSADVVNLWTPDKLTEGLRDASIDLADGRAFWQSCERADSGGPDAGKSTADSALRPGALHQVTPAGAVVDFQLLSGVGPAMDFDKVRLLAQVGTTGGTAGDGARDARDRACDGGGDVAGKAAQGGDRPAPPRELRYDLVLRAGDTVVAKAHFLTDSEEDAAYIQKGQRGTIALVDSEGDAYIKFDGHSKKQWVYSQRFGDLAKVPFLEGDTVCICRDLSPSASEPLGLQMGLTGTVVEVDGGGGAHVQFHNYDPLHLVHNANLVCLARVFQEMTVEYSEPVHWQYMPPEMKLSRLRSVPDINGPKSCVSLRPGDVFEVAKEQRGGDGILYLQLSGGRGWMFEGRPGTGTLCWRCSSDDSAHPREVNLHTEISPYSLHGAVWPVETLGMETPKHGQRPLTLENAKELLTSIQATCTEDDFRGWIEAALTRAKARDSDERLRVLRSRGGELFTKACGPAACKFGFEADRAGFDGLFEAILQHQGDRELCELAVGVEESLHLKPGSWFGLGHFHPGMTVYLTGPSFAPHLQGAAGVLRHWDGGRTCWSVWLHDEEDTKLVRQENMALEPPRGAGPGERQETEPPWWVAASRAALQRARSQVSATLPALGALPPTEGGPPGRATGASPQELAAVDGQPSRVPPLGALLEELDREAERQDFVDLGRLPPPEGSDDEVAGAPLDARPGRLPSALAGVARRQFREAKRLFGAAELGGSLEYMTGDLTEGCQRTVGLEERYVRAPMRGRQTGAAPSRNVSRMPKPLALGAGGASQHSWGAAAASGPLSSSSLGKSRASHHYPQTAVRTPAQPVAQGSTSRSKPALSRP